MFCVHCGKELWENARFCQACGAPVAGTEPIQPVVAPTPAVASILPNEKALFEEERTLVQCCHRLVNRERLAWKSVGIVLLVLAVMFLTPAALMQGFGQESAMSFYLDYLWVGGFVSLVVAIVNLVLSKKTAVLCASVYTDIRPIVDRYSGSAAVVFSAVFNVVAMIFVIETATKIKSQAAVLERIVRRQQTPCI